MVSRWSILMCVLSLLALVSVSTSATAQAPLPGDVSGSSQVLGSGLLHNPGFDNHDWYEFKNRYGNYLTGSWLPDDDNNQLDTIPVESRQDWRVWFMNGWDVIEVDPESTYVDRTEAVQMRAYGEKSLLGGIYQVVYNVTPCLSYEFSMLAQSRPEGAGDNLIALQVGIDRAGWALPTNNPAVQGTFPATTVWGAAQKYQWGYGALSVTAEAWADKLTVYTYAHADGGRSQRILWDTGAFREATAATIYDPLQYAATSGIVSGPNVSFSGTNAFVNWTSTGAAVSQVFYREIAGPATTPAPPLPYTVFLPLVMRGETWLYSAVAKNPTATPTVTLTGLKSGYTYEYFVVSRGLSGNQCVNWVSLKQTFVVP